MTDHLINCLTVSIELPLAASALVFAKPTPITTEHAIILAVSSFS